MNPLAGHILRLSLGVTLAGCSLFTPDETLYLRTAQDHASQQEVRQRLGTPVLSEMTGAGETVLVYHVMQQEPGAQNSWATAGSWCDEYVLTFDTQGILRHWTNRSERHGGETIPVGCVRGGYVNPSDKRAVGFSPYSLQQIQ
jgi:hypothetical protein